MTFKPGVDLGAAFDILKQGLTTADSKRADYSIAYGYLAGTVEGFIDACEQPSPDPLQEDATYDRMAADLEYKERMEGTSVVIHDVIPHE